MKNDKQKYLSCRPSGTLQCVMANPYMEQNEQLKKMALTIQVMHQKLEDNQLELAEVRKHYKEALNEIDEWRSRAGLPKINEVTLWLVLNQSVVSVDLELLPEERSVFSLFAI